MELTLLISILIPVVLVMIIMIFHGYSYQNDYEGYKYQCHQCKKKFRKDELKDLRGPWHTKDWTCPHCKYQNVTLKSYDY